MYVPAIASPTIIVKNAIEHEHEIRGACGTKRRTDDYPASHTMTLGPPVVYGLHQS